jgi:hypothetical protein
VLLARQHSLLLLLLLLVLLLRQRQLLLPLLLPLPLRQLLPLLLAHVRQGRRQQH